MAVVLVFLCMMATLRTAIMALMWMSSMPVLLLLMMIMMLVFTLMMVVMMTCPRAAGMSVMLSRTGSLLGCTFVLTRMGRAMTTAMAC
jgi:hypothetical protein